MPHVRTTAAVGGALVAAALTSAAPAAAATPRCRENQIRTATYSLESKVDKENFDGTTQGAYRADEMGAVKVGAVVCRQGGRWTVMRPIATEVTSVGVNAVGDLTGYESPFPDDSYPGIRGWGVTLPGGGISKRPRIRVKLLFCKKKDDFASLKLLAAVPIPGTGYLFSIGQTIVPKLLPPAKVRCADAGSSTLRLTATGTGRLRVRHSGKMRTETTKIANPRGEAGVLKRTPRAPRIR